MEKNSQQKVILTRRKFYGGYFYGIPDTNVHTVPVDRLEEAAGFAESVYSVHKVKIEQ
ncbi:MAG: hypothetical protein LUH21_19815 [Clostridiales bacterium]|nr:hypothetical protein [Clostridiales bacterium]